MPVSRQPLTPKIDASLLAEYIPADTDRRREIVLDQCAEPQGPTYYRAADETVCSYLLGIPKQERAVKMKIEVLRALGVYARDKIVKIYDNIAALEAFLEHPKRELLDDLEMLPGPRNGMLRMAGVDIAVAPEIIAVDPKTDSFGLIKLRFSRSPLGPHEAGHLTSMLQAFAQACATQFNGTLNLDLTCVVDVFDGTIIRASSARAGRWSEVRAACAEIATSWAMLHARPRGAARLRRV
jgi:hypothetical protein